MIPKDFHPALRLSVAEVQVVDLRREVELRGLEPLTS